MSYPDAVEREYMFLIKRAKREGELKLAEELAAALEKYSSGE